VVLAALKQNGLALQYASEDLQADKEVVLTAVRQNADALKYASDDIKADKAFMFPVYQMKEDHQLVSTCRGNRPTMHLLALAAVTENEEVEEEQQNRKRLRAEWKNCSPDAAESELQCGQHGAQSAEYEILREQYEALCAKNEELQRKIPRVTVINVETNENEIILAPVWATAGGTDAGRIEGCGLRAMAQAREEVGLVLREVKVEKAAALVAAAESRDRLECVVCMAAPRSCLYLPCAHLAVCEACDKRIAQGSGPCPICSVAIDRRFSGVRLP